MKAEDFARFLMKLDRNKAPIRKRNVNKPVWSVDASQDSIYTTFDFSVTIPWDSTAYIRWNGEGRWEGTSLWADDEP